jgi:AP2-like factor (ANT lineage)
VLLLQFPLSDYEERLEELAAMSRDEVKKFVRRKSDGFSRGRSSFRGVTRHHQAGRWEARIGRIEGSRYLVGGARGVAWSRCLLCAWTEVDL